MKEIKIEKRKPVWPWVLASLGVIALLIYWFGFRSGKEMNDKAELISVNENNSTVAGFVSFTEDGTNKMALDHAYTNEALLRLTDATSAMAGEIGYDVSADLSKVKEYAAEITKNPFETTHADNIRDAVDILTNVLQNMQQAKYPQLSKEAAELRNATASINPGVLTLDQKDAVKSFFHQAADLLRKMN